MGIEPRLLLAAASAILLALLLTPVAIRVAGRLEFFDRPAGYKEHGAPTPYLGGAAVMAAALIPFVALSVTLDGMATAVVAGAVGVLWAVGTLDDRRHVSPGARVAVELAVAAAIWAADLGWELGLGGAVDLLATGAWVVLVINAVNLFDNLDGASSSVAGAVAAGLAVLALAVDDPWLAALAAATAGACLGFLQCNLARPARIFLGDGGSMPLGLLVATAAMVGAGNAVDGLTALALAAVLVGLPLLDTSLVLVSRRRRGVSFLTGGRDHLSHRVLTRVGTPRRVAGLLAPVQLVLSAVAIAASQVAAGAVWIVFAGFVVLAATVIAWLELAIPPATPAPAAAESDRPHVPTAP